MNLKSLKKYLKIASSVLWWIMVIALIALLISVIGAKIRGEIPELFGFSIMKIVSGSMDPEIPVGTYILIRRCEPADIQKGDIISFYSEDPTIYGLPNTHRVVEDPIMTEKGLTFVTKGDVNVIVDTYPVSESRLIGVYEDNIDWLTKFAKALDGNMMFTILISLQIGIVIVVTASVIKTSKEEDKEE